MGSVSNARLAVRGLQLQNKAFTLDSLQSALTAYYKQSLLKQIYVVLGSLDSLGNPAALFGSLGSGVKDFFYEPAKGLVQSPKAFGKGLAKGTLSLVSNTMSGVFGSASSITTSLGKGVARLGLESEAEQEQRRLSEQQRVAHVGQGLMVGGQRLATGIVGGLTGVFTEPVKGAKQGGLTGFLHGSAKGVLGLVTKPAAGALGLASATFEGIGNTAVTVLDEKRELSVTKPVRPPRNFAQGIITSSGSKRALGIPEKSETRSPSKRIDRPVQ